MAFAKAKTELIEFLKFAPKAETQTYTIILPLMPEDEAQKFVHRMRVELGRFRTNLKIKGKTLRHFKMIINAIETHGLTTHIILRYRDMGEPKIIHDVDEVFDIIATGSTALTKEQARMPLARPLNFGRGNQ